MPEEPRVSILLPNLNNRPYLDERMQTIMAQTFSDWELIIVDNYSDDGAWEFFQDWAAKDPRINISQAPRKGMYANWNNCISLAKGEYVYIATSDDTMTPDFLEIMVNALDKSPQCDLAHCKLKIIDENGNPHPGLNWDKFFCTAYFGDLIDQEHIRTAPHDGLLHCGVRTVYTSITQLLIRRNLFDKIGLFLTGYGSIADFEWEMRASLVTDTIHIPGYLATWRVHRQQGTDQDFLHSSRCRGQFLKLMDHAFKKARAVNPALLKGIKENQWKYLYLKEKLDLEIKEQKLANSKTYKYKVGLKWLIRHPKILLDYYRSHSQQSKKSPDAWEPVAFSKKMIAKYGLEKNIVTLSPGDRSTAINFVESGT